MWIFKSIFKLALFHLQFLLIEFGIFLGLNLVFSVFLLEGDTFIGIPLGISQLATRTVFGNFIAYYFIFKLNFDQYIIYTLSLFAAMLVYVACILVGGEISKLALILLETKSWYLSVFGGIVITNYVMLRKRQTQSTDGYSA